MEKTRLWLASAGRFLRARWGYLAIALILVWAVCSIRGCYQERNRPWIEPQLGASQIPQPEAPEAGEPKGPAPSRVKKAVKGKVIEPSRITGHAKPPAMPLAPYAKGPLSNLVVVLDPGHGGPDSGSVWEETFDASFFPDRQPRTYRFYESSYTYRMVWQLSEQIRSLGGMVYLTAYSEEMLREPKRAQDQLPAPTDAVYWWGGQPVSSSNLRPRRLLTPMVMKTWGNSKRVAYMAIHINSGKDKEGHRNLKIRGAHVRVWDKEPTPPLATIVGKYLVESGYIRSKQSANGEWVESDSVVRTEDRIGILATGRNVISNRMLLELAEPGSTEDSYRMRDGECRASFLKKVLVASLKEFAASP